MDKEKVNTTEISKEDLQKENEDLKQAVQALQNDVTILKETIVRMTLKSTGLMK